MTSQDTKKEDNGYLFTLEVLVKGSTNGRALEKLLRLLNDHDITDYRIVKGIHLGQVIEAALQLTKKSADTPVTTKKEAKQSDPKPKSTVAKPDYDPLLKQIQQYKEERRLVRLSILKGKGVKLDIPCRILNHDPVTGNITVYHVDEKKVYTFRINEIDDLNV